MRRTRAKRKNNLVVVILFLVLILPVKAIAQSAKWVVNPIYTSLDQYADGLFKYHSGTKVGLLNVSGTEILPILSDSITDFSNGYALALIQEDGKYKINSIISESGYSVSNVQDSYYVPKYGAVSEGMLCVTNKNGFSGFLDATGELVIECKYTDAHPFCEGYASVMKKDRKVMYINKEGNIMQMEPGDGVVYFGSSFSNGEAVVYTINRKGYVIDKLGRAIRSYNVPIDQLKINSIDYRICGIASSEKKKNQSSVILGSNEATVFKSNDFYGYRTGKTIILPAQFESAKPFYGGYAVASLNGKYGILKLIDGLFIGHTEKANLKVQKERAEQFDYSVKVPSAWQKGIMKLTIDDGHGFKEISTSQITNSNCSFSFIPSVKAKRVKQTYDLSLSSDNLLLWASTQDLFFNYTPTFTVLGPYPAVSKANEKDNAYFSVTIRNNTSSSENIVVSISGNEVRDVSKTITIAGNSSEILSTYIPNVLTVHDVLVNVRTSADSSLFKKKIRVVPFY